MVGTDYFKAYGQMRPQGSAVGGIDLGDDVFIVRVGCFFHGFVQTSKKALFSVGFRYADLPHGQIILNV